MTGIATAYMDSIPVVAITCNVGVSLLGRDSFQEIDIAGVTMPITKYNFIVKDITKLASVIRRAFVIAKSGRPGPVLVDITKDVTANSYDYEYQAPETVERQTDTIEDEDIELALMMIKKRRKALYPGRRRSQSGRRGRRGADFCRKGPRACGGHPYGQGGV